MAVSSFINASSSTTSFSKTIEKVFDEAQYTGEINLSGRKLKDFPKIPPNCDLSDTVVADISKNNYSDIPSDIFGYSSLECLNAHHNSIKLIPENISNLCALTRINLSRNLLCNLPPCIGSLQSLKVIIACNNKLVSLPEELCKLQKLMHLDVSCNEISYLPPQLGEIYSLCILNVRRNRLVELPLEICQLNLRELNISENKISSVPCALRKMESLEVIDVSHNPLVSPPAHVCKKGRVHIMKFLQIESVRKDFQRGALSETDMRRMVRRSFSQQTLSTDEVKNLLDLNDSNWKRNNLGGRDSGYSTTDSSNEKCNLSPMDVMYEKPRDKQPCDDALYREQFYASVSQQPESIENGRYLVESSNLENPFTNQPTLASYYHTLQQNRHLEYRVQPRSIFQPAWQNTDVPNRTAFQPNQPSSSCQRTYTNPTKPHHDALPHPRTGSSVSSHLLNHHHSYSANHSSSLNTSRQCSKSSHPRDVSPSCDHPQTQNHLTSYSSNISHNNSNDTVNVSSSSHKISLNGQPQKQIHSTQYSSDTPRYINNSAFNSSLYNTTTVNGQQRMQNHSMPYFSNVSQNNSSDTFDSSSHNVSSNVVNHPTSPRVTNNTAGAEHLTPTEDCLTPIIYNNDDHINRPPPLPSFYIPASIPEVDNPDNTCDFIGHKTSPKDDFSKELERQKAEYERRRKVAEQLRIQEEAKLRLNEVERDERRRAALHIQEEQQRVLHEQKKNKESLEAARKKTEEAIISKEEAVKKCLQEQELHQRENNSMPAEKLREIQRLEEDASRKLAEEEEKLRQAEAIRAASVHQEDERVKPQVPKAGPDSSTLDGAEIPVSDVKTSANKRQTKPISSTSSKYTRKTVVSDSGARVDQRYGSGRPRNAIPPANLKMAASASNHTQKNGEVSPTGSMSSLRSDGSRASASTRGSTSSVRKVALEDRRTPNSGNPNVKRNSGSVKSPTSSHAHRGSLGEGQLNNSNKTEPISLRQRFEEAKAGTKSTSVSNSLTNRDPNRRYQTAPTRPKLGSMNRDSDPSFTMKRQARQSETESGHLLKLRQFIESRLKITLSDNIQEDLRNGVTLCHLANQIRPRSVSSIHVPSPAMKTLTVAKCRKNVENFLEACHKIGVEQSCLCSPQDILECKGTTKLFITLSALITCSGKHKESPL